MQEAYSSEIINKCINKYHFDKEISSRNPLLIDSNKDWGCASFNYKTLDQRRNTKPRKISDNIYGT